MRLCPLDSRPLQEVVGHHMTVFSRGGSIHVPTPAIETEHNNPCNHLTLIFCQEERSPVSFTVELHDSRVVGLVVNKKSVPLTCLLVKVIEGIEISLPFSSPYVDALACRKAHIITPFFFHVS